VLNADDRGHRGVRRRLQLAWLFCIGVALFLAAAPERSVSASQALADIALTKGDSPDPVSAGGDLRYTLTVTNGGPDRARGVSVSDPLPTGVSFLSVSSSQGTCTHASGIVTCSLGSVFRASSATVTILVRTAQAGTLTNTSTVSTFVGDPNPANNSATVSTAVQVPSTKPNIVLVMTDDQGALDGREIGQMPTVKSILSDHGVTFSDFHSETPRCCPARANTLSGQHTHNHGVTNNSASLFDPAMTLATQLQSAGYHTFLVGKYMNRYGSCQQQANCAPTVPAGWNRWAALGDGAYWDYDLWVDGSRQVYGRNEADYSTDVIAARAASLIRSAPAGKPLFAWIAPFASHSPTPPAPRHVGVPCSSGRWEPPSWNEADVSDKPAYVRSQPPVKSVGRAGICRTLLAVDDLVGRVRDELVASGRYGNTLLIYMGDNGMLFGEHRLSGKSAPYQTQIPFLVSWPDRLGTTPRTISERVQNIDLAPTLCQLAGCTLGPFPNGQTKPDGISFAQLLLGQVGSLPRDAVLEELPADSAPVPAWYAVTTTGQSPLAAQACALAASRGCRWHYIEYPSTGERELYDVSNGPCWAWSVGQPGDPCELDNLASRADKASLVTALHNRLLQLKAEKGVG
jgi:N-acetylglucosamine-6-sulfatase